MYQTDYGNVRRRYTYFAWISSDGMLYRFSDLKRNETGRKFEKEVTNLRLTADGTLPANLAMLDDLYRYELEKQRNCEFCPGEQRGAPGEPKDEMKPTGSAPKDEEKMIPDWQTFANGDPAIVDVFIPPAARVSVTDTTNVTATGMDNDGTGKEIIDDLPIIPPRLMPTPPPQPTGPGTQKPPAIPGKPTDTTAVTKPAGTNPPFYGPRKGGGSNPPSVGTYGVTPTNPGNSKPKPPQKPNQNPYQNQYGNQSTTPRNFANRFKGLTYQQIIVGDLGIPHLHVPNKINQEKNGPYSFVDLSNGKQVDMVHFLVVGRLGHLMGTLNEIKQTFDAPKSAFYPQDLYSNRMGVKFFTEYGDKIGQNPTMIADYIYEFLTNPLNL